MSTELKTNADANVPAITEAKVPAITEIDSLLLEDCGLGMEEMSTEDFMIPRIMILQALSPRVNKNKGDYIKDSEPGMILETIDNTLFDGETGITVVPVYFRRTFLEWKDRSILVKDHGLNVLVDFTVDDKNVRTVVGTDHRLIETAEYYVLLVDNETGTHFPAVLSMSGSQLRKSRKWNSMMNNVKIQHPSGEGVVTPATFYMSYSLVTCPESNDAGDWFGWSISKDSPTLSLKNGKDIYLAGRDLLKRIKSGEVKAKEPVSTEDSPM